MPHIIFYLARLNRGGTERVVVNLAEYLHEQGYQVTIATTYSENVEFAVSEGIRRILTAPPEEVLGNNRLKNFMMRFSFLRNVWRTEKPDIIISFIGKNNMMAILTSLFLKIPVLVAVRGEPTLEYYNKMLRLISKTLFILADGIILQTNRSKSFFPRYIRKKATVLPNPLNPDFMVEPYKGERDNRIVIVGRIDENKNQKMLIDAFHLIAEEFPDTIVDIIGDGPDKEKLEAYVSSLHCDKRIRFSGPVLNVREWIYNAGVYVLVSNTEGMPNALIEAMVLGIPSIATDCPCGGPAELIQNDINGLLVPVGDEEALADALRRVLCDKQLQKHLSQNALLLREKLAPEIVNKQWEEYICSFLTN